MNIQIQGPAWNVDLTHSDVSNLNDASVLAPIPDPLIKAAVIAAAGILDIIDKIGGNNGVSICGIIGVPGTIVTPANLSFFSNLIQLGQKAGQFIQDNTGSIGESIIKTGSKIADAATSSPWSVAAVTILAGPQVLLPLAMWKVIFGGGSNPPQEHKRGAVEANRAEAKEWEKFVFIDINKQSNTVALLSWQGHFCAEGGGGGSVYANRSWIKEWETWTIEHNDDGTVSFKSINGHYLVAEDGGGRECNANRPAKGEWEKFWLDFQPGGYCNLRTLRRNQFVSVQP